MIRAQEDMKRAATAVQAVGAQPPKVGEIYGSLCHSFPVMVRTCGLCQAAAFSAAKLEARDEPRQIAHRLLLEHIGDILGLPQGTNARAVVRHIQEADAEGYMYATRRILMAWIYYKRFAESILRVANAAADQKQGG